MLLSCNDNNKITPAEASVSAKNTATKAVVIGMFYSDHSSNILQYQTLKGKRGYFALSNQNFFQYALRDTIWVEE
jgi:hypothetical protein